MTFLDIFPHKNDSQICCLGALKQFSLHLKLFFFSIEFIYEKERQINH